MTVTLASGMRDAKELLQKFGVLNERKSELVSLLDRVTQVDEDRVTSIAQVIQYMDDFNDLVSKNVGQMEFSDRYRDIRGAFTSIRNDSQRMVDQLGDGRISGWERFNNKVRYFFKGTPHDRFLNAIETFYKVCNDVKKQISIEETILNGYQDFRELFKGAEIMSLEVKKKQEVILTSAGTVFKSAFDEFTNYKGSDEAEKSRLELARDKAERAFKAEKRNLELLTNVSNDLKTSYNLTRNIVESLETTHENKDGLYQREISFVNTHEVVFTMMDAAYASLYGLNEQARTFKELKEGLNEGLKQVGKITSKVNDVATEQRYGVSVDPEAVRSLNTDLTTHLEESIKLAEQHSTLQTKAVAEIEKISQEGVVNRQRLAYAFLEAERTDSAEIKLVPSTTPIKLLGDESGAKLVEQK